MASLTVSLRDGARDIMAMENGGWLLACWPRHDELERESNLGVDIRYLPVLRRARYEVLLCRLCVCLNIF